MGNAAKYAARFLKGSYKVADKTAKGIGTAGAIGIEKTIEPAAKFVGKKMFSVGEKNVWNGYTGLKETPLLAATAWAGAAAWGLGSVPYRINTIDKSQTNVTTADEPAYSTYDYVSSSTNAPTLGASGNLVFGLHNGRRG